jgi:hypothetical protein
MLEKSKLDRLTTGKLHLVDVGLFCAGTQRKGKPAAIGRETGLAIVGGAGSELADFGFSFSLSVETDAP